MTDPNLMSMRQELHLARILNETHSRISEKYRKGAAEHGGDLQDATPLQILDMAIDEAVDQIVYLLTVREKMV